MKAYTAIVLVDHEACLAPLAGTTAIEIILESVSRTRGIKDVCIQPRQDLLEPCQTLLERTHWKTHINKVLESGKVTVRVSAHYPLLKPEYLEEAVEQSTFHNGKAILGTSKTALLSQKLVPVFIPLQYAEAETAGTNNNQISQVQIEDHRSELDIRIPSVFSLVESVLMYGD